MTMVSEDRRAQVFRRDNYRCVYCGYRGNELTLEAVHVVPTKRHGTDELSNLQTACTGCLREKGSRTGPEYRDWRRRFPLLANKGP